MFSLRFLRKVPVFLHLVRGSKVRESQVRWSKVRGWCIGSRYLTFKKNIFVNSNYTILNLINYKQQCQDPCWGSNLLGSEVFRLLGFSPHDDLLPASISAPKQDFETIYSKRSMLIHILFDSILFDSILWSTLFIQSTRWLKLKLRRTLQACIMEASLWAQLSPSTPVKSVFLPPPTPHYRERVTWQLKWSFTWSRNKRPKA